MSSIATAVVGGALVSGYVASESAEDAAHAADKASRRVAAGQTDSLDYLKEVEKLPRGLREAALTGLGEEYGLTIDEEGNVISSGASIEERARTSPFFTGAQTEGEEAILRNAPMTGGLRSGNVQDALAKNSEELYMRSYLRELQGLEGLSNLPSYARDIADVQTGIGQTRGAGIIAAAQAEQQGQQAIGSAITGATGNLLYAKGQGLI